MSYINSLSKYLKYVGIVTAGLLLGYSCSDDISESSPHRSNSQAEEQPLEEALGKVGFAFEAELSPKMARDVDESGKALSFYLEDRDNRRGNKGGTEYPDEYAPTLALKKGDQVPGTLIFLREPEPGGTPAILRMAVAFEVTSAPDRSAADYSYEEDHTIQVKWKGDVPFPTEHSLAQEFADAGGVVGAPEYKHLPYRYGRWHVMGFLGSVPSGIYFPNTYDVDDKIAFNYSQGEENRALTEIERYSASWTDWGTAYRGSLRDLDVPFISQWQQVRILKGTDQEGNVNFTGLAEGLKFRPQGTLLMYDLGVNLSTLQDVRQIGVISNALDFRGYYSLNGPAMYQAFLHKDADGVGIPEFVPKSYSLDGMEFYDEDEPSLHTGERIYPYDLITTSHTGTAGKMWGGSSAAKKSIGDNPTMFAYYYTPGAVSEIGGNPSSPKDGWLSNHLGGWYQRSGDRPQPFTRSTIVVWGMPRKVRPAHPATLFVASVTTPYNERIYKPIVPQNPTKDVYEPGAKVRAARLAMYTLEQEAQTLDSKIAATKAQVDQLTEEVNRLENPSSNETEEQRIKRENTLTIKKDLLEATKTDLKRLKERKVKNPEEYRKVQAEHPQSLFTQYAADSTTFYDRNLPGFLSYQAVGDQPYLTLHQSNVFFDKKKIYHARPTLSTDLMITDIFYEHRNGQNYSSVEITNSSYIPVDLTKYAIARLVPSDDGTYLAFRTAGGGKSDRLADAQLLPLSAIGFNQSSPYEGTTFPRPAGIDYSDHKKRRFPLAFHRYDNWDDYGYRDKGWFDAGNLLVPPYWAVSTPDGATSGYTDLSPWYMDRNLYLHEVESTSDRYYAGTSSFKKPLYPAQSMMLGASGYLNRYVMPRGGYQRPLPPLPNGNIFWYNVYLEHSEWYKQYYSGSYGSDPNQYRGNLYTEAWGNGRLRHFHAYADGKYKEGQDVHFENTNYQRQYEEGTLDYHPGDAFVLVKTMADGSLQIIDATGPVGRKHLLFPGTYADFKAEFAKYKNLDHFSVQKKQGIEYPFMPPYNTVRVAANQRFSPWSDTWRVVQDYADYTMGYYEDPRVNITDNSVTAIIVKIFPPYQRHIWKNYDWAKYKRLKPNL